MDDYGTVTATYAATTAMPPEQWNPTPAGYAGERPYGLDRPLGVSSPNNHTFECRHATHCFCGATGRVPGSSMPAGL